MLEKRPFLADNKGVYWFCIGVPIGMSDVTRILYAIEKGDLRATDEHLPLVYAPAEIGRYLESQKNDGS